LIPVSISGDRLRPDGLTGKNRGNAVGSLAEIADFQLAAASYFSY
jgi:hypothetical protein